MLQKRDIGKPYKDELFSDFFVRTFSSKDEKESFVWHKDYMNRKISIISGSGWKLQMDNSIPINLVARNQYYIPKEVYHRIIRGNTDLTVLIKED